jgi:hypothetical protein
MTDIFLSPQDIYDSLTEAQKNLLGKLRAVRRWNGGYEIQEFKINYGIYESNDARWTVIKDAGTFTSLPLIEERIHFMGRKEDYIGEHTNVK